MSTQPRVLTPAQRAAVTFEKRIRNAAVEHAALFRPDGTLIDQATGVADEVEFPQASLSQAAGATFTHNQIEAAGGLDKWLAPLRGRASA